ncbi:MAG: hypothetical protein N3C12_01810 [Candidatus Binatia bacterium]|nr:hypothetical protein [Candidatus Binatia bacterium]
MIRVRSLTIAGIAWLATSCGDPGAPQYSGSPPPVATAFGTCAFCHADEANGVLPVANVLACTTCHADARPGVAGPGHRAIPSTVLVPSFPPAGHRLRAEAVFGACAFCHNATGGAMLAFADTVRCETCHPTAITAAFGPRHRSLPNTSIVPQAAADPHAPGAERAWGSCSLCHNEVARQMQALGPVARELACSTCHREQTPGQFGRGHFTLPGDEVVPEPATHPHALGDERAWGSCSLCHNQVARDLQEAFGSQFELSCSTCHSEQTPGRFGPGHYTLPPATVVPNPPSEPHRPDAERTWGTCALCHNKVAQQMHALGGAAEGLACSTCHREQIPGQFGPGHFDLPRPDLVPVPAADPHAPGPERVWGACALCHNEQTRALESVLGPPSDVRCDTCHADALPGMFAPGHRRRPSSALVPNPPADPHRPSAAVARSGSCAYCHAQLATNLAPVTAELSCTVCHREVTAGVYGPGHRRMPDATLVPAFVGADHALGIWQPFGTCAYCHRDLSERVAASNAAELGCVVCHDQRLGDFGPAHRSLPTAELVPSFVGVAHDSGARRVFGTCTFCHSSTADRAWQFTHGTLVIECEKCHMANTGARYGEGHQSIVACVECHGSERKTHHDPASGTDSECANCHQPHGSPNLFLIRDRIVSPAGGERPLRLENLRGQDDAGFTSVSEPGSGLCEVCHTATRFFRSDGGGEPHFTFPCFTCHPHALGFSVRP